MAKTTTKKTQPKRFVCRECGKRTHLGKHHEGMVPGSIVGFSCQACVDAAEEAQWEAHEAAKQKEQDERGRLLKVETRESWLLAAVEELRPLFLEKTGKELPERVSVSVGFPGGGSARKRIGECWVADAASDGVPAIFISPVLGDPVRVLETLVHELVHAMGLHGHPAKGFGTVARAVGLEGKLTATHAGETLVGELEAIAERLGPYGHGAITLGAVAAKKQGTRMLKVECANGTGYKVRMTRTWLDELGAPLCACCSDVMVEG